MIFVGFAAVGESQALLCGKDCEQERVAVCVAKGGIAAGGFEGEWVPCGALLFSRKRIGIETGDDDEAGGDACELAQVADADSSVASVCGVI